MTTFLLAAVTVFVSITIGYKVAGWWFDRAPKVPPIEPAEPVEPAASFELVDPDTAPTTDHAENTIACKDCVHYRSLLRVPTAMLVHRAFCSTALPQSVVLDSRCLVADTSFDPVQGVLKVVTNARVRNECGNCKYFTPKES